MLLLGLFPMPVSVQTCISPVTKDEEHSMCQNPIRVIFNIIVLLITTVIPLSGLASVLGAIFVYVSDQNMCSAELQ